MKAREKVGDWPREVEEGKRRGFMIAPELRQSVISKARQGFNKLFAGRGAAAE